MRRVGEIRHRDRNYLAVYRMIRSVPVFGRGVNRVWAISRRLNASRRPWAVQDLYTRLTKL